MGLVRRTIIGIALGLAAVAFGVQGTQVRESFDGSFGLAEAQLQWQNIIPNSERVTRGGIPQHSSVDYYFSPTLGQIRFLTPLRPGETVEITYEVTPGQSSKVQSALQMIDADFFSFGPAKIDFVAGLQGGAANFVGLKGGFAGPSGWNLTGQYLFGKDQGPDNRMMILAANGAMMGGKFTGSWTSAGLGFTPSQGVSARPGVDSLRGEWRNNGANGSGYLTYAGDTYADGTGKTQIGGGVNLSLAENISLAASRSYVAQGDAVKIRDRIGLNYMPAQLLTFGVEWNGQVGDGGTTRFNVDVNNPIAHVTASHTMADGSGDSNMDVSTDIRMTRGIRVQTTAHAQTGSDVTDTKLWLEPTRSLGVAATYMSAPDSIYPEAKGVEVRWQPRSALQVTGSGRRRDLHDGIDPIDSVMVNVAFRPLKAIALNGSYADRPEDKMGLPQESQQRTMGATLNVGSLFVTGNYIQNDPLSDPTMRRTYQLESGLRFSKRTSLKLTYGQEDLFGDALADTRTYGLGFQHAAGRFNFSLEGVMKQPYLNGIATSDREIQGRASLGLGF